MTLQTQGLGICTV